MGYNIEDRYKGVSTVQFYSHKFKEQAKIINGDTNQNSCSL